MVKNVLLIVVLFFCSIKSSSQSWDYSFLHYGKNEGFPSNTIYCMLNDKFGRLWIGTDAGLCCFDGNELKVYDSDDGIPNNDVFQLYCDSKNRIWIVTMGKELSYFHNGRIHSSKNSNLIRSIKTQTKIVSIFEDFNHAVWVVSFPFILNKIENDTNTIWDFSKTKNVCFSQVAKENGIYFITQFETFIYEFKSKSFRVVSSPKKMNILGLQIVDSFAFVLTENLDLIKVNSNQVYSGKFTSITHYWQLFNSDRKIWKLSNKGIKSYTYSMKDSFNFLRDYPVSNYVFSNESESWISTLNNGLYKLNSEAVSNFKPNFSDGLNSIHSVFLNSNKIIVGNNNGEFSIINKFDKNQCNKYTINENARLTFRILKILQRQDKIYLGTDIGAFCFDLTNRKLYDYKNHLAIKNIYCSDTNLIALTNSSVIYLNKDSILKQFVVNDRFYSHTIYQNKKLFGSENALYYEDDSLKIYKLDQSFHYRLMDMKTKDSLLVIATAEKGVFFINGHQIIRNLNIQGGLNSNSVTKILEYKNQWVIATNNGIAMYDFKTKNLDKIMESDGLASNNVLDIAIDNDTLYAGTDNGLSVIPINSLKPRKSFKFFLNPISVNKDTIWNITDTIKSHTGYRIYAALNAISLGVKGGVTFYYRVNERDSNFYATNDPNVNLTFSKVGTYTFEAYGIDINNIKSVRSILTIVVVPFWYQTQVFKWSCIIAALLFIYLFIRVLSHYVRKREQEKIAVQNRITKLELDVWKSNINPHFLYNSLNIIQSLFLNNKFEDANRYVGTFTSVLRNTIDNSEHLMNKIDEEIQYLHDYLELECMKRNGRLSFEIQADETSSVTSFYMPSLLLQPIVENSIKHGLKQGANCHILIQFELKGELIVATVQDNGPGLPEENKNYTNSKGLSLVQDKIRLVENITNQKIVFVMGNLYDLSNKPCGVISRFTFPLFSKQDFELS